MMRSEASGRNAIFESVAKCQLQLSSLMGAAGWETATTNEGAQRPCIGVKAQPAETSKTLGWFGLESGRG
jgi:hypothetical protein